MTQDKPRRVWRVQLRIFLTKRQKFLVFFPFLRGFVYVNTLLLHSMLSFWQKAKLWIPKDGMPCRTALRQQARRTRRRQHRMQAGLAYDVFAFCIRCFRNQHTMILPKTSDAVEPKVDVYIGMKAANVTWGPASSASCSPSPATRQGVADSTKLHVTQLNETTLQQIECEYL